MPTHPSKVKDILMQIDFFTYLFLESVCLRDVWMKLSLKTVSLNLFYIYIQAFIESKSSDDYFSAIIMC